MTFAIRLVLVSQIFLLSNAGQSNVGPSWVKLNKADCSAVGTCPGPTEYMSSVVDDNSSLVKLGVSYNGKFVDFQIDSFASQFEDESLGSISYEIDTYILAKCAHFLAPNISTEGCDSPGGSNCRAEHMISTSPSIDSENLPNSTDDCKWKPLTSGDGFNLTFPFEVATLAKSSTGNMTILYYRWQLSWAVVVSQQLTLSAGATLEVGESQEIQRRSASAAFYYTATGGNDVCQTSVNPDVVFRTNQRICVGLIPEDADLYNVDVTSALIRDNAGSSVDLIKDYEVSWFGVEEQVSSGVGSFLSFYFPGSLVMDFEDGIPATLTLDFTVSFTGVRRALSGDEDISVIETISQAVGVSTKGRSLLQTEDSEELNLAMVTYFFSKSSGTCDAYGTLEIDGDDITVSFWEEQDYSVNLIEALARAADVRTAHVTVVAITDASSEGVQVQFRIVSLAETAAAEVVADLSVDITDEEFPRLLAASAIPGVTTASFVDISSSCSSGSAFEYASSDTDDESSFLTTGSVSTFIFGAIIGGVFLFGLWGLIMRQRRQQAHDKQLASLGNKQQVMLLSTASAEPVQVRCNPVLASEDKKGVV